MFFNGSLCIVLIGVIDLKWYFRGGQI